MPITVPKYLPASKFLEQENIFVMDNERALMQEIRPLKIALLNLMPTKEVTEIQLLRLLANNPLQIEVVFLKTATYNPKNTDEQHLNTFYLTFEEAMEKNYKFDGMIITGAPVEKLDFESVLYWEELQKIMEWAKHNVYSTMYICWAAQAAMFYNYGINKYMLPEKIFGIFKHNVLSKTNPLVRCFNDEFEAPHSRYTQVEEEKVYNHPDLEVLAVSEEAGIYLVSSKNQREVFVFGHGEYDLETLHNEYSRDKAKGLDTKIPQHYYANDKDGVLPRHRWRAHEALLISNWLNYCVYQATPFDLEKID